MSTISWSKFYTPKSLADRIISLIPEDFTPDLAIDICVGSGNFLEAAAERWTELKLIGVDLKLGNVRKKSKYILYQFDALESNELKKRIKFQKSVKKIVLANPPFGKLPPENNEIVKIDDYLNILRKKAIRTQRIEALMLVSNLSILNNGDYFAAVLPENFFTSISFESFREEFLRNFEFYQIGDSTLYFSNSEVKTRTFHGKFRLSSNITCLQNSNLALSKGSNKQTVLERGIDNSKLTSLECLETGTRYSKVLHFSNDLGVIYREKFVAEKFISKRKSQIELDDLLIIRVGRKTGYIHQARKEYVGNYVSDYFYVYKSCKLTLNQIRELSCDLIKKSRGLTTKYISKSDIYNSLNKFNKIDYSKGILANN